MKEELWKNVQGFEGFYQISNYGRVKSFYNNAEGFIRKNGTDRLGYKWIGLRKPGLKSPTHSLIHRLVALHFVPNPNPDLYLEVNHIDGNKENNYYENLEWCTRSYNVKHAFDNGLKVNKRGAEHPHSIKFYQFDLEGHLIAEWKGVTGCARTLVALNPQIGKSLKVVRGDISACLNGRYKSACGFIFSFDSSVNPDEHKPDTRPKKPIIGVHKKTGAVLRFPGVRDAEGFVTDEGEVLQATMISKCCLGKRKSHGGYVWSYVEK